VTGPPPAVAAIRCAVRDCLVDLAAGTPVCVALSGGPDSVALLAGAAFLLPGAVTALVVDHGWHPASAQVAAAAATRARDLGTAARVLAAPAPRAEAAARSARYDALACAAERLGAPVILLGHTRDDQAESVLLGLLRGSGPRSLGGMASRRGAYRRPLLHLPRSTTVAACAAQGLAPHADPANDDLNYARVRVRREVLPMLATALGRDVATNLARTAELLRADTDLLDQLARSAADELAHPDGFAVGGLLALPAALRRRVLHDIAPGLRLAHVAAMDALVTNWHGQGPVALPDGARAVREHGRIRLVCGNLPAGPV